VVFRSHGKDQEARTRRVLARHGARGGAPLRALDLGCLAAPRLRLRCRSRTAPFGRGCARDAAPC
jgi:hypothetical protein